MWKLIIGNENPLFVRLWALSPPSLQTGTLTSFPCSPFCPSEVKQRCAIQHVEAFTSEMKNKWDFDEKEN